MQGGADGVPICSDLCACFLLEQVVYVLEALEKGIIPLYTIEMNICPTRRIAEVGRGGRLHWFSYLGDFTPYLERYRM